MKTFVVYDKDTGKIFRAGSISGGDINDQALARDEAVIEGVANDKYDMVDTRTKNVLRNHIATKAEIEKKEQQEYDDAAPKRAKEKLIAAKMRELAINALIKEGKIEGEKCK